MIGKSENNWKKITADKATYHELIFNLASNGLKVCFIECSHKFDPYLITQIARKHKKDHLKILERIFVIRVFNIHHLKTAIEKAKIFDYIFISGIERLIDNSCVSLKEKEYFKEYLLEQIKSIDKKIFFITNKILTIKKSGGIKNG
ncbi:hypothetical protein [Sulfurihydrogenibium subterraneum]|uniref:hypothetical protein n=1 Tax=Sulfurihydrogenibium subterraneum TaxID=171121 RepID=UPI00048DB344|nr:hypothetical protein [Sulfurihydrogenibium subterraneum]